MSGQTRPQAFLFPVAFLVACTSAPEPAPPNTTVAAASDAEGRGTELAIGGDLPSTEFGVERALVEEAEAAIQALDLGQARDRAARAVAALVARKESDRGREWLELLTASGGAARTAKDPRTARVAWEHELAFLSSTLPDDHPDVLRVRQDLAISCGQLGDLRESRRLFEQVLEARSRTLTDDDPDLQAVRGNLAYTLRQLGELHAARDLEEQVLEFFSRTRPDDDLSLAMARLNLAGTLHGLGELQRAGELCEKVLEVRSKKLPDDHPDVQMARLSLAANLAKLGDHRRARPLLEKAVEVCTRTLPADHPDLMMARQNLAATLKLLGDLRAARVLEENVLEASLRVLPDDHGAVQLARQNLAGTLYHLGDLEGARTLHERVLEVRSRTLPDDHPDLATARMNLATAIDQLGDLRGARALEEEALEAASRTLPDDHPDLQYFRQNLASTLASLGELHAARALFQKVLEVRSATLPGDHPALQVTRLRVADMDRALGDVEAARALGQEVLEAYSGALPDDHPYLQAARGFQASTLGMFGDFQAALALQEKVLEVASGSLPADHPLLESARHDLALTLAEMCARDAANARGAQEPNSLLVRDRARCAALIGTNCRTRTLAARQAQLESSPREAEERCERMSASLDAAVSFAFGLGAFGALRELDEPAFLLSEATRGAALGSAATMRCETSSPEYAALRAELRKSSEELAVLAQKGTTSQDFQQALARRDEAQRRLVRLARELTGGNAPRLDVDLEDLAKGLGERDAIVAFRTYERLAVGASPSADARPPKEPEPASARNLCAFIVRAASADGSAGAPALALVDLGPLQPVERAVQAWRASLGVGGPSRGLPTGSRRDSAAASDELGSELRRLVFDPLRGTLRGTERWIVVLDEVLHLVPWDGLPAEESATGEPAAARLGDRQRIETRVTLTELSVGTRPEGTEELLVAVGGVRYEAGALASESRSGAEILRGGAWSAGFPDLPETNLEARAIAGDFEAHRGPGASVRLLEGSAATRERFLETAPSARWLHVATHGWFASESIRSWSDHGPIDAKSGIGMRESGEQQVKGMSPMLLCGLALAGANLPENGLGRAPGLLTAEEIAGLDLARCELAVLSACDTNVGERRAGQGVASLQKALQMAGARSVITSLWKVPDEATRELMTDFYRRIWVEKVPKGQALWEAKKKLRDAKDESGRPRYSTRDWAAWVLTGEPD